MKHVFTLPDILSAAASCHGEKVAVIDKERSLSYTQVEDYSTALADRLAEIGVQKGDRVAVHLDKSIEAVVAFWGVVKAGAVFVPIDVRLLANQVRYRIDHCTARCHITAAKDPEASGLARDTVIVGIDELPDIYGRSPSGRSHVPVIGEDMAAILYTSGSTGYPKGAILSHGNLVTGARIVVTYLENCPDDVILSVLPFHFDYGLNQLITSFLVGATLVLQKSTFPSDICRTLIDRQITGLAGVPTLWVQLLSNSPFRGLHFPAIRYITNSGGAVPVRYLSQLKEVLRGAKIYLMYGLTEAFRSSYLPPEGLEARPTSIGKAIPGVELLVIDEQGGNCQAGQVGELVHRGGVIFRGYWNDPEGTSKILRPAPFASAAQPVEEMAVWAGDLVSRDEEGFLYFVGRKDEMIKSAGYRISPQEIEDVLYKMDVVEEAVAFGIRDDELGERISVVVSPRGDAFLSEELVMQFCRRHLPSFMVPGVITIIPELPKGPTGKLDRNRIKCDYGA